MNRFINSSNNRHAIGYIPRIFITIIGNKHMFEKQKEDRSTFVRTIIFDEKQK